MRHTWSKSRKLLAVGLLLIVQGSFLPDDRATARVQQEKVVRIQQQYYPDSLDPQQGSGGEFTAFLSANYEGLTRLDHDLTVVPAAAERWEFDAAGTFLSFHLRDGLTYSDGTPLTAERFADAVRRTCDPNVPGDYQYILFDIAGCEQFATLYAPDEDGTPVAQDDASTYQTARSNVGVEAPDERTLEIRLTHPAPYFPAIAGLPVFYPSRHELIAQGGEGWSLDPAYQIGNGPFQITRMDGEQVVELEANPHYWAGPPQLDRLEFIIVADSSVALEAYRTGDLDMIRLDPEFQSLIEADTRLNQELVRYPGAATSFLSFNLTLEPFTDQRVREAFAYAFDQETYCALLRGGACVPASSWIPPGIPGHVSTNHYAFDPDLARQSLADSSYGGPEHLPEITFVYWNEDPLASPRVEWIAGQYRDILGVEIALQPREGKMLVAMMSDPATYPPMALDGWVQDYPDPQNWLSAYWTCRAFASGFGYCNPEFDALVDQADREFDPAARMALYDAAGRLLRDDVPGVFISHPVFMFLVDPAVSGYEPTPIDAGWPGQTASLLTLTINE